MTLQLELGNVIGSTSAEIEARIEAVERRAEGDDSHTIPSELLRIGEEILENWVCARGMQPTSELHEGFRLLALHRQGARGEPSFNACRETARELVFHHNLLLSEPMHPNSTLRIKNMVMVARHLHLFVTGKLENAGLGEFCCAAKPMRNADR